MAPTYREHYFGHNVVSLFLLFGIVLPDRVEMER